MKNKKIMDWLLLVYGLLILGLVLLRQIHPKLFQGVDSNVIFAWMILGFTILTVLRNKHRGLDRRIVIQQILLALVLILAVAAIARHRM